MSTDAEKLREKRRKYIPGLAAMEFKPKPDWSIEKARQMYSRRATGKNIVDYDSILYEDCIEGMKRLPRSCVDLVIADPPFGIEFSGKEL
jgi:hypothetical protein